MIKKRPAKSLFFVQPNGSFKKGGDGRSKGMTATQVAKAKGKGKKK